jgi:hypothetical protein
MGAVGAKFNSLQVIWNGYNVGNIAGVYKFEILNVNSNHDNN